MRCATINLDVDEAFGTEQSIALRYAGVVLGDLLTTNELAGCSRREGVRIVELGSWRGVELLLLDESSLMASGTYKSLDGCISTALCRKRGIKRAVFSSGANAGSALSLYGGTIGLRSFFFCPAGNLRKLDGGIFERSTAHLIAVEGSDRRVKQAASLMSQRSGAPLIPELAWRFRSAACRGLFIGEKIIRFGHRFDWLAQAVCAGYGPIGIYRALTDLVRSGQMADASVPRFLAVQQAGLCPIATAWAKGLSVLPPLTGTEWREEPIEPALYNVHPDKTYPELYRILRDRGGDAIALHQGEFETYAPQFLGLLENAGILLTRSHGEIIERAGVLAGAGVLRAIADGRISQGSRVLCSLTGGAGQPLSTPALPDHHIGLAENLATAIEKIAGIYAD